MLQLSADVQAALRADGVELDTVLELVFRNGIAIRYISASNAVTIDGNTFSPSEGSILGVDMENIDDAFNRRVTLVLAGRNPNCYDDMQNELHTGHRIKVGISVILLDGSRSDPLFFPSYTSDTVVTGISDQVGLNTTIVFSSPLKGGGARYAAMTAEYLKKLNPSSNFLDHVADPVADQWARGG